MLTVLVGSVASAASLRTSLNDQYYDQLAREAAESGIARARQCMSASDNTALWVVNNKPLTSEADCSGDVVSGMNARVLDDAVQRSEFSVSGEADGVGYRLSSRGQVQLYRSGSTTPWKTHSAVINNMVSIQPLEATDASSGIFQVCGIFDGKTWCWGRNNFGQLGIGIADETDRQVPVQVLRETGALQGKRDKLVAVGNEAMCIATDDNEIYCSGRGPLGNGGTGSSASPLLSPTPVDMAGSDMQGKTITSLVMGQDFICAIASQDLYCWGLNDRGQLGVGDVSWRLRPVRVPTVGITSGKPVTAVSATPQSQHACAIVSSLAYCWGLNDRGQLGDGTQVNKTVPTAVTVSGVLSGKAVVHIASAGGFNLDGNTGNDGTTPGGTRRAHSCAVTSDGGVYCWGSNQYGQMGQGSWSMAVQSNPVKVNGLLAGKSVTQVSASYGTVCALTSANLVYCWGQNSYGQVGDGTMGTHRYSPVAIVVEAKLTGKTITAVNGGVNRHCVTADYVNYCWGLNSAGQLGDGTFITRSKPTEAKLLRQYRPALIY